MANEKNKSLFSKIREMTHLKLEEKIEETRKSISNAKSPDTRIPYQLQMRNSLTEDPQNRFDHYGFKPKLSLLTDTQKLQVYLKDPIISSIIQNRTQQVSEFSRPQKDKYSAGFVWERKDKESLDDRDKKNIEKLNEFILRCGFTDKKRDEAEENLDFETFLKLIVKDRLIYDSIACELIYDGKGNIHHFLPVSSSTIRFAAHNIEKHNFAGAFNPLDSTAEDVKKYKYVQIINEQIQTGFLENELVYKFGNPTNEIFTQGYSIGELDLLITTVTSHINADTANRSVYTRGFLSQGIINLKGEIDEEQVQALRRSWYNQGVGPDGMNRTPIVNSPEGLEFIRLDSTQKDMGYLNYIDYLIKIVCSIYQIAPEEINFSSSGNGGGDNSQNYNNVESRLKISKDRGLTPLLRFVENIINEDIICRLSEEVRGEYVFKFIGLDSETKADELSRHTQEVRSYKTVNEIRQENNMDPIEGGDIVLDGIFFQWYQMYSKEAKKAQAEQEKKQQEQMAQQQAQQPQQGMDQAPQDQQQVTIQGQFTPEEQAQQGSTQLPWDSNNEDKPSGLPWENKEVDKKLPFEKSLKNGISSPELIKVEIYRKK